MADFVEKIRDHVVSIGKSCIPDSEKDVLRFLFLKFDEHGQKVTQHEIATALPHLGAHKRHEKPSMDSTLRQVRQIIRNLRVKRWAPILSDTKGYWIPREEKDVAECLARIEGEVKSRSAAGFETYKAMKEAFGVSSAYFEGQGKLLEDAPIKTQVESATKKGQRYDVYRVVGTNTYVCSCPGYLYRKNCRHVEEAANRINK